MSGFVLHKCHLRQSYSFFNSCYSEFSASLVSINLEKKKFSTESYGKERLFDIVIIGGGIVGLATSLRLKKRFPEFSIAVIEKEPYLAAHQSGNNGGVIHSGIYYKPGSLKAKLCIEGIYRLYKYCEENNIPYKRNGKLIVATNEREVKWLKDLYENGIKNNVKDLQLIDSKKIKEIEPYCKGLKAIYSPNTGVINYGEFTRHIGHKLRDLGGNIFLNFCVTSITEGKEGDGSTKNDLATYPVKITNDRNMTICARFVVTCGGLNSDKLAEMTDEIDGIKMIPIRGEYYFLPNEKKHLVQGSIYEVPNPSLPFHGVHFTSQLDGKIFVGPIAMLTPIKEGFQSSDYNLIDLWKLYSYPGLQLFLFKYFKPCFHELLKSVNSNVKLDKFKQFIPSLKLKDLIPKASVGVQAIALDINGKIVEEFKFIEKQRILHCRSMPSPAATSSLAIASYLADKVQKQLKV